LTTPNEYVAYALGYRLVVVVTGSARSMHFSERSRSLYAVARPSVCRLSVALVRPIQAVEIFGNILRHLVPWPSADIHEKIYGDRSTGEPHSRGS